MEIALSGEFIGEEMEGEIKRWMVADNAGVAAGELIAEIETGKAVVEITAPVSGTIKILKAAGTLLERDEVMARIL